MIDSRYMVRVEAEPHLSQVAVYAVRPVDRTRYFKLSIVDGELFEELVEQRPGEASLPVPLMRLAVDLAADLGAALTGLLPPDQAQAAHLKDAIAVRDRLLTIVERPV